MSDSAPATIRLTVVHGHLAFARSPVLVGHYEGDTFAGAEAQLDRALGFRLTERRRLGLYPGRIGTATVVLDPAARPRGAVVVGLGETAALASGQLRRTLRNGLLTFATAEADRSRALQPTAPAVPSLLSLSVLAVGTGDGGLDTASGIIALLQAAAEAQAILSSAGKVTGGGSLQSRFCELELIEVVQDRALAVWHAVARAIEAQPEFGELFELTQKIDMRHGRQRRGPPGRDPGWWLPITIRMTGTGRDDRVLNFQISVGRSMRLTGRSGGEMWTDAHRVRHEAGLKEMVTQDSVEEMARWLEQADPPRSDKATGYGPVVAGIAWHLRVGGNWRALPGDFPCWRTVYGWFRRWCEKGLFDQYMQEIARRRRQVAGRRPNPRLGIIDTQVVKCIPVSGPRGYDAGKRIVGRKRVALVDADGHWLAISVVPASVQDRDTLPALDADQVHWPSLREAVYDGAFTAERCEAWSNEHGMRHTVVRREPAQKGFVVLPRRWVVERSFGWLVHWGGVLRERAGRLDVAAGRLACVAALSGLQALRNPQPVQSIVQD